MHWACGIAVLCLMSSAQAEELSGPDRLSEREFIAGEDWVRLTTSEEQFQIQLIGGDSKHQFMAMIIADSVPAVPEERLVLGTLIREKSAGSERELVRRGEALIYVPVRR